MGSEMCIRDRLEDNAAVVRGAAIWALSRLDPARFTLEYARLKEAETEPSVAAEWELGRERSVSF